MSNCPNEPILQIKSEAALSDLPKSKTPGGSPLVLTPDNSTPGKAGVRHKLTRYVAGLTDGATYYVVASTNQTNLQGNTRFTEKQVIGLAELENEARAGVMIDIGPVRGTGYILSAKHVLDSGFATGLGVVSQLNATNTANATAGLTSEDRNPTPWTKFLNIVGTNVPALIFSKLTETFANVAGTTPLSVTGALAFSYIDHDVLTGCRLKEVHFGVPLFMKPV